MQTVKIIPLPRRSKRRESQLREAQLESGNVYTFCKNAHQQARRDGTKWPTKVELQAATKGRYALHSQSIQMTCHALIANIETTKVLRREHPKMRMRYPWRDKTFYPVMWPAQAVTYRDGRLILPMGRGRRSIVVKVKLSEAEAASLGSCRLVWRDGYELHVCREVVMPERPPSHFDALGDNIGEVRGTVDLGQIHQAAVTTNTGKALLVSGRGIRAVKRARNKALGQIGRKRSRCRKGSKRWKKLQAARRKITRRAERRCRTLQHQGTAKVMAFCREERVAKLYVGNPDGVQRKPRGRHQNQRMSQWEFGRDIDYLQHKSKRYGIVCFTGTERGTSSQCPECHHKQKARGRRWRCRRCGFCGHRDVVGSVNMHELAFGEQVAVPQEITYRRAGAVRLGRGMDNHARGQTPVRRSSLDAGRVVRTTSCLELESRTRSASSEKKKARCISDSVVVFSANSRSSPPLGG